MESSINKALVLLPVDRRLENQPLIPNCGSKLKAKNILTIVNLDIHHLFFTEAKVLPDLRAVNSKFGAW